MLNSVTASDSRDSQSAPIRLKGESYLIDAACVRLGADRVGVSGVQDSKTNSWIRVEHVHVRDKQRSDSPNVNSVVRDTAQMHLVTLPPQQ